MSTLSEALNMLPIDRQKEIIGKWLDSEQAACEFALWAADKPIDFGPHVDPSEYAMLTLFVRKIQRHIVADVVAHDNYDCLNGDPEILEFFRQRMSAGSSAVGL